MDDAVHILLNALKMANEAGLVPWWAGIALVLLVAVALYLGSSISLPKPVVKDPEPTSGPGTNTGGGPEVPDAVMDDNVVQNTDPNAGPPG